MMDALILNRLQRAPQRVKDLAGGSDNWLKRRPIRAALNRMEVAGLVRRVRLVGAPYWVPADWVADGDWLRDYLLGNTVQTTDGCMRWAGAMDSGQITARVDGEKLNVRTELWRLYGRKPLPPGFCVRSVWRSAVRGTRTHGCRGARGGHPQHPPPRPCARENRRRQAREFQDHDGCG